MITIESLQRRIVSFEAYQHPAWDPAQPFTNRIQGLPLFFLEFIHHARIAGSQSTTITHYVPCRNEFRALADIICSYGRDLTVCDIGCGNGFLGSLLAREGVAGFGIDDRSYVQPQIAHFYDQDCYSVVETALQDLSVEFDVAFCAWMNEGSNLTPQITARNPVLIVHIFSRDQHPDGTFTTGTIDAFKCPENYRFLTGWQTIVPEDYFLVLGKEGIDLTLYGNPRRNRSLCVYLRHDVDTLPPASPGDYSERYDWDLEREYINSLRRRHGLEECLLQGTKEFST